MTFSARAIGWHVGSLAAGALAMLTFTASHSVDLYALFDQLNEVIAAITKLLGLLAPFLAAGAAGYRTWQMKAVPHDAVVGPSNAVAIVPIDDAQPFGTGAQSHGVKGVVVAVGKNA